MGRPTIFIGCGGAGVTTLLQLKASIHSRLRAHGWVRGLPDAWQFIAVDAVSEGEHSSNSGEVAIRGHDYIQVIYPGVSYNDVVGLLKTRFEPRVNPEAFRELIGWLPSPHQLAIPLYQGSGQLRAVGRATFLATGSAGLAARLKVAEQQIQGGYAELELLLQHIGVELSHSTTSFVFGSMAGGTGSGIMLDVIEQLNSRHISSTLIAYTQDIFKGVNSSHGMTGNSLAFMSELMSASWNEPYSRAPTSGVFLIGSGNIDGQEIQRPASAYAAVAEMLAGITTTQELSTLHSYQIAEWNAQRAANSGGLFRFQNSPAVVSSYGTATVEIGRAHLRNFIVKLLVRDIIKSAVGVSGEWVPQASHMTERFLDECGIRGDNNQGSGLKPNFLTDLTRYDLDRAVSALVEERSRTRSTGVDAQSDTRDGSFHNAIESLIVSFKRELDAELRELGEGVWRQTLLTVSESVAKAGLQAAISLIEASRIWLSDSAESLELRAVELLGSSDTLAQTANARTVDAKISPPDLDSDPEHASSVVRQYVLLRAASTLHSRYANFQQAIASSLLPSLTWTLRQSLNELRYLADNTLDLPAFDLDVPQSLLPREFEFLLEDHGTWRMSAASLLAHAVGKDVVGLSELLAEVRRQIFRGDFVPMRGMSHKVGPLLPEGLVQFRDVLTPNKPSRVDADFSLDGLESRACAWLTQQGKGLSEFFEETLDHYLGATTRSHIFGPEIDHSPLAPELRISVFGKKFQQAFDFAKPLIEIDDRGHEREHPWSAETVPWLSIPISNANDAARNAVLEVINRSTDQHFGVRFQGPSSQKLQIITRLRWPVHASSIKTVTGHVSTAVAQLSTARLRSSFLTWRRSTRLDQFIPLPRELRVAAVRGFAVARILGTVTALPFEPNVISDEDGIHPFPTQLLTTCDKFTLLPSLLESIVLTLGDAPTRDNATMEAYGSLIRYGSCHSNPYHPFEITGIARRVLITGDYGKVTIVDEQRAQMLSNDPEGRVSHALGYVENYLDHLTQIKSSPLDNFGWKTAQGANEPLQTLALEMIDDLMEGFQSVRDELKFFEREKLL